jgi:methionine-rich copper-binding protein CopC
MKRIAILAIAIAGLAAPAMAHAFLEKASPAAGENLHAAPAKIALHFSEPLEPAFSSITVTNAAGADMRAGPPSVSGGEMDQALKPLAPGRYRVTWHAVSVDTHRTAGKYNFLVLP